jgi:hypothetical protein
VTRAALRCSTALLAVLSVITIGACGKGSTDIVARVGRTSIAKSELKHWEAVRFSSPGDETSVSPRDRALSLLIWSAQTAGRAEELSITVSDGRVRALLEELEAAWGGGYKGGLVPREAELQRQLNAPGETTADRFWLLKMHLVAARVEQAEIAQAEDRVSRTQVVSYYKDHRRRFVLPERRNITAVMTWHESQARKARRELEAGESARGVVDRFNEQPTEGGLHVGLARKSGKKRFERDFFAARPHVLIGPRKELMYYVFEVTKVTPPRQQGLDEVETTVRRELVSGKSRGLLRAVVNSSLRRWRAKTRCAEGDVVPRCGSGKL